MKFLFFFILLLLAFAILISIYKIVKDRKLLLAVTKTNRGTSTERQMILKLLKYGIPHQTIFHDLYLKKGGNHFCQIDLVIVTKVGIFVFEIKKYNGWIFGNTSQNNWTQVLAYGKNKYRFYNPIIQNKKHIEDLRKQLIQFQNVPFYSVIVFFGNCSFRNQINLPFNTFLVKSTESIKVIKNILDLNEPIAYRNKREIMNLLRSAHMNGDDEKIRTIHIENIKTRYKY